jgi:hypothetical protein
VGLFDALLGRSKLKGPATRDRLFAMSTAQVALDLEHGIRTAGAAGLVFQPIATGDFRRIVEDAEAVVRATGEETGSTVSSDDDAFGYRWVIVRDDEVEDLVVGLNAIKDSLDVGGYGERILAAVFAFRQDDRPVYFIYNVKRGFWYPFVPAAGDKQRDNEAELRLRAQLGSELPIEPELERWFPLWGIPI